MKIASLTTLFIVSLIVLSTLQSNGQVRSKAYDIMLKVLLSHSVEEAPVDSLRHAAHVLDARERREYEVSHVKGAHWVGYEDFVLSRLPEDIGKSDPIYVYCSVGYRSEKVAEKLEEAGYEKVHNVYGGFFEWVNQGNEIYNDKGRTNKVHAYNRKWGIWLKKGEKIYE